MRPILVECKGVNLFDHNLPSFICREGDLLVISNKSAEHTAGLANLRLCESLLSLCRVEGFDVYSEFCVANQFLRALTYDLTVSIEVYNPVDLDRFAGWYRKHRIRKPANWNEGLLLKRCLENEKNVVFSFMGLDSYQRDRAKELVLNRPKNSSVIIIEGVTSNFDVTHLLPQASVINFWK